MRMQGPGMTWQEMLAIVCGSGILSAIITLGGEYFFKSSDYKLDYYKKIIDKRLNAYEELEAFIGLMDIEITYELEYADAEAYGRSKITTLSCFCNIDELKSILDKSITICALDTWYSPGVKELVNLLNKRLVECLDLVGKPSQEKLKKAGVDFLGDINPQNMALCMVVGEKNEANLRAILTAIKTFVIEDRMTLHKVDKFFKKKAESPI